MAVQNKANEALKDMEIKKEAFQVVIDEVKSES
jgi:hypothetical protein